MELYTIKQEKIDSLGDTNDNQSLTSSPCYVNVVPVDDEVNYFVSEMYQQLKESVEHYIACQRNVLSLLHIIVPDLDIVKVSPIDDFVTQFINLNSSQGCEVQSAY